MSLRFALQTVRDGVLLAVIVVLVLVIAGYYAFVDFPVVRAML